MNDFSAVDTRINRLTPADASGARSLGKQLQGYGTPVLVRSVFELLATIVPFILLWAVICVCTLAGFYPALIFSIPAAGFLLRLFIIQHDCGHGAFFASRRTNDWLGHCLGVLTMTPYAVWRRAHARHHATSGNLDQRGIGDIDTLTVAEFRSLPPWRRRFYRIYRHPAVMFGLGPAYLFLLRHRLPVGQMRMGWKPWGSAMLTNAAFLAVALLLSYTIGLGAFIIVHLPILLLAASMGVWLFFVQHQFEETHWAESTRWTFHTAALHGSSFYVLPPILHWFSGNIGYHHIHHLVSRIPFYRLAEVTNDHPELQSVGRVSVRQSLRGARLALWDEAQQKLVTFRTAEISCSR